jgi:asparagine synthase (glutamine-hydrolysing)
VKGRSYVLGAGAADRLFMCGIAGFLTAARTAPDHALLAKMCDRLAHRGPDTYGSFCNSDVALGYRRLSVIDLRASDEPLGNEDGSIRVAFNGEIYNYRELRSELLANGHRFTTETDTEVLVHLYEEVGEQLPQRLNGMFAFAIWDARRQELFLARDRLGKKPLYYSFSVPGFRFCFGSELKALAALPGFQGVVSHQSVADFLALSYVPDPATIYSNVARLQPGHSLVVSPAGVRMRKYWEPVFAPEPQIDGAGAAEEVRALAAAAVRCRTASDVPLGAFLSGGVDSSAVVAILASKTTQRVRTFSIGFTDDRFDERRFARLVAGRYGTEHHEEIVSPSIQEILEKLLAHFDEPFGDSSAIPMLYLARSARRHVTVALGGDGADELFGGYRRYYFGALEERLRRLCPAWFRQSVFKLGARYYPKLDFLPQVFRAKTLLTNLSQEIGDAYFTSMSSFRDGGLDAVLSEDARRALRSYSPRESFRARFQAFQHLSPLEQMQAVDFQTYLPGDILVKADRATMAYSLEARSPWLDYRLVEFACRLPHFLKVRGRIGKYIFKQAMAPAVPAAILERRKMGFSIPLAHWFRTSLKPIFEAAVLTEEMVPYLSLAEVRRIWMEHQSGLHNHDKKLWNLLMLGSWLARSQSLHHWPGVEEAAVAVA